MFKKATKFRLFPQSFSVDAVLTRRLLDSQGYQHIRLQNPFLYRGDTRGPDVIFTMGFYRKVENNEFKNPKITTSRESKELIACTKDLVYAVGFADCPAPTQGFFSKEKKPEYSWVYLIYAYDGVDISDGKLYGGKGHASMAGLVNEVDLTAVPPEHILAAFQIKTTKNSIVTYYNKNEWDINSFSDEKWHILITDFKVNDNCSLKLTDPDLYDKALSEFSINHTKGYFYIPWSPHKEEKDFAVTHNMDETQKEAYRLGFSKDDVFSNWFSWCHLDAAKDHHIKIDRLRNKSKLEAYGLGKGLNEEQLQGLTSETQVDGMHLGFTKDDVLSSWFTWRHNYAAKKIHIDILRGKTEFEAEGLSRGLTENQVKGLHSEKHVDGLVAGFTREDVFSDWFGWIHTFAAESIPIAILRGKTAIEVEGLRKGLSFEQVSGLHSEIQIEGLLVGFTKEDVESKWFDWQLIHKVNQGCKVEDIRHQMPTALQKNSVFNNTATAKEEIILQRNIGNLRVARPTFKT